MYYMPWYASHLLFYLIITEHKVLDIIPSVVPLRKLKLSEVNLFKGHSSYVTEPGTNLGLMESKVKVLSVTMSSVFSP